MRVEKGGRMHTYSLTAGDATSDGSGAAIAQVARLRSSRGALSGTERSCGRRHGAAGVPAAHARGSAPARCRQAVDPTLREIDQLLEDEVLVDRVTEALAQRHPQSRRRGRLGTPASVVLRMLVLKHLYDWRFDECE